MQAISDFLEPTCGGPTAWWAAKIAKKYQFVVSIGYPEITTDPEAVPDDILLGETSTLEEAVVKAKTYVDDIKSALDTGSEYWTFNSTLTIGSDGKVLAHYRKTHLYYSDVVWSSPSMHGFSMVSIPFPMQGPINTSFAICMDLNPKAFTAEWDKYEVAQHLLSSQSALLVVSTAWLTNEDAVEANEISPCCPEDWARVPDMESLMYWRERLTPLVQHKEKTIVVIANRIGNEEGAVKAYDLDNLVKPTFGSTNNLAAGRKIDTDRTDQPDEGNQYTVLGPQSDTSPINDRMAQFTEESSPGIATNAAHYSGSSAIMVFGNGKIDVYGNLGRGIQGVLVGDTNNTPVMSSRYPSRTATAAAAAAAAAENEEGEGGKEMGKDN